MHILNMGLSSAVEEVLIAIVRLYQKYTFELDSKLLNGATEFKQGITVSPKEVPVTARLR